MGQRGPSRKPTHLRLIEGVPGHHRPIDKNEPVPRLASSEIPEEFWWLSGLAKACWLRWAPEAVRMRTLGVSDLASWAMACESYADFIRARLEGKVGAAEKAEVRWSRWSRKFGLSPGDRAAIQMLPGGDADDEF